MHNAMVERALDGLWSIRARVKTQTPAVSKELLLDIRPRREKNPLGKSWMSGEGATRAW